MVGEGDRRRGKAEERKDRERPGRFTLRGVVGVETWKSKTRQESETRADQHTVFDASRRRRCGMGRVKERESKRMAGSGRLESRPGTGRYGKGSENGRRED